MSFASLRSGAALVAAAILGGAVAVGGVALLGGLDSTTTVVTETSAAPSPGLAPASGDAMSVNEIYERASSGVVRINASDNSTSSSTPPFGQNAALGSGFVIDKSGHIVTNYHVVRDAGQVTVSFSNRDTVQAEVVGTDPSTDLAVLRVETAASALTPLSMGNSDAVRVGDPVVAIGNPFGLDRTVTAGIVSALQRLIQAPNRFTIDHVIQTDAPINPGNSGGPLLNARGQVIGVNTQIETGTGSSATGNVGIGFAVPSNTVKDVVAQILRTGRVDHAYLGISGQALSEDVADRYNLPVETGVLVGSVTDDSGADKAGIQGGETEVVVAGVSYTLGGDIIVAFEGKKISSVEQLRDAISGKKPGDEVKLVIYRDASRTSVTVTLGRQPASPQG
ncbi:MAG TPA: trypsin-like peptidase domain-containing protein [Gaiellaceae bacterium]|nr:trypsin-like peptidase domain-containing protein [Gaiellaceae bacterium]